MRLIKHVSGIAVTLVLLVVSLPVDQSIAAEPEELEAVSDSASEEEELTALLQDFLARSSEAATHERFWADDLIYTSSRGTRFGKTDILAGFEDTDDDAGDEPSMVFSGEEVQVRIFGTTAVVAFKLVGTPRDDSPVQTYFNTGTFVKRDDEWRAVAWQATIIPTT